MRTYIQRLFANLPKMTRHLNPLAQLCIMVVISIGSHHAMAQESAPDTPPPASVTPENTAEASDQTDASPAEQSEDEQTTTDQEQDQNQSNIDWADSATSDKPNFDIIVESSNKEIQSMLEKYLELYRYRMLSDLTSLELRRLLEHTENNIRSLTSTLGYFSPEIKITVIPADQRDPASELPLIQIQAEPGPITTVKEMRLQFEGDIQNRQTDLLISSQRRRLQWSWAMREDDPFTQSNWSSAKSNMLQRLTSQYYPAGKISASQAAINPQDNTAALSVTLDSGPRFYLGEHYILGLERYSERMVRNFTRLRAGDDFLLDNLTKAQRRLAESGYFDGVFLYVDPTDPNPEAAKINIIVREAYYQSMTIGPGYSTDNGPRLTFEYRNNEVPLLGWQSVTALKVDQDNQKAETTLSAIPDDDYWRLVAYGKLEHLENSDEKTTSAQARFGNSFTSDPIDKSYFIQYDKARTENLNGINDLQSVTLNGAWTLRNFNNFIMPTRGWGLGVELGVGSTFGSETNPFIRVRTRMLGYLPMESWRNGRFELRGEFGGVFIKEGALIPSTLMFRTGGDTTVRGYAFRYIGVNEENRVTSSGKYMVIGSVEYQRPIFINDRPTAFDWAVFVDTGAVSNRMQDLNLYTGVGAGVRWRSPVGPLKFDLAYGLKTEQIRLHFNVGFVF